MSVQEACDWQLCICHLPGDNSETGVLDGVGLCPGGRKCVGDPLLDPLALPPVTSKLKSTC